MIFDFFILDFDLKIHSDKFLWSFNNDVSLFNKTLLIDMSLFLYFDIIFLICVTGIDFVGFESPLRI